MSLEELTASVRSKIRENVSLGHTVMFDLGADGVIFVDGTVTPAVVDNERREPETTFTLSADLLGKMLNGEGGGTLAYMTGKLKISGSMGVALKINGMLDES
jgi:putative sterol carrier protein